MQDPAQYMNARELGVPCAVEPLEPATIDSNHVAHVNWEVFFFSNAERKATFMADPLEYCGALTDPVSHQHFKPGTRSPRVDYMGQPYYFFSDSTRMVFESMPDSFSVAKRGMTS